MRDWYSIERSSMMSDLVHNFNENAKSCSFLDDTIGTMLWNGVLFKGLETVGGKTITPLQSLDLSGVNPEYLLLDNISLYFKKNNKFLDLNMETINLKNYNTNRIQFLFFSEASNGSLSYRVADTMDQLADELLFARFQINTDGKFQQFYIMAQRVGTNMYNAADEFYVVDGCYVKPSEKLYLGMTKGTVKRSGIDFTDDYTPDIMLFDYNITVHRSIRYIETDNTIDYTKSSRDTVITDKYLNYDTKTLINIPEGKYSIQRILWDIYDGSLIIQYGDQIYDDYSTAVSGASWLKFPAPYNAKIFIPLAAMIIKSGTTDLTNEENLIIVRRDEDVTQPSIANEDTIARAQAQEALRKLNQEIIDRKNADGDIIDGTTPVRKADSLRLSEDDNNYHDGNWYRDYTNTTNKPRLDTTQTDKLNVNSNEIISGLIKLHKISKTGAFKDLVEKPTTISGYGITDAYTKTQIDNMSDLTFQSKITAGSSAPNASTPGSVYLQYV